MLDQAPCGPAVPCLSRHARAAVMVRLRLAQTYISQNLFENIPCLLRKEKFPEIFPVWVLEGTPLDPSGDPWHPSGPLGTPWDPRRDPSYRFSLLGACCSAASSAAWMMSASVDICWSPNIHLSSENTRWGAGGKRKTIAVTTVTIYDHYDR